ncbi:hypothetical protein N7530_008416 [Penicillium desertorum]|uniref:Uncharacterized protein n=1 Tax=Penicillium desertorum TaxID=1303715 RepID=A0A9W9WP64_9EURO|nr:hypothetical protein N7530_008416 [Penicillium desertorum]
MGYNQKNALRESEISKIIRRKKKNKSRETSRRRSDSPQIRKRIFLKRQAVSLAHSTTNLRSKPPPS